MSVISEETAPSFRLSMLINDTRYRSLTFQFIALILLIAFMAFMGINLINNLAAAGLNISYEFLGATAGYDINQTLIEYDSQSTHMQAAWVGILNTLLVAFLGCVSATILGVIAGVLRLSGNWLVAKLMSLYVEAFRNVPVLIWILIIGTIVASLPAPRAYRGENPDAEMIFGAVALTNRGVYVPSPVWGSGAMIVIAVFIASIIGVIAYRRYATKLLYDTGKLLPTGWPSLAILTLPTIAIFLLLANPLLAIIQMFGWAVAAAIAVVVYRSLAKGDMSERVTQIVAVLLALGGLSFWQYLVMPTIAGAMAGEAAGSPWNYPITLDFPELKGFNFQGGIQIGRPLIALWLALSIYTGAFIAENVRAGIMAVSKGQTEAANALGLRANRTMSLVVLPQALRVIIPPLISQYLNITKNSSLAIAVGYADITATLGGITLNQTGRAIEALLLLMLFYLTISLSISAIMNVYNKSVSLKER